MGRKLQTIYEYFSDYTEKKIEDVIYGLSIDEKLIIMSRFGNDLHNPSPQKNWSKENSEKYYGSIVPKMKRLLSKDSENTDSVALPKQVEQDSMLVQQQPEIEVVDFSAKLLQLLSAGKNNREICEVLNISSDQLYDELLKLKNRGIRHSRKYYSDGSIKYSNVSTMQDLKNYMDANQDRTIITDSKENSMKFLLISDLHFVNELERIDLIDGAFTRGSQKISDLYEQIEYFIKHYPQDKSILTFSVAGDHDISAFNTASLDIIEMCNNFRHDIVIGGYNNTGINLKNDQIHLYHHIEAGVMRQTTAPIILHGHSHKYSTEMKKNSLNITIPTLSNINQPMPTALELDVYFSKGYIANLVIKHLYFGEQDIVLGESTFDLLSGRNVNYDKIINVEPYRQNLKQNSDTEDVLRKINRPLSQIEKFNKRYGK